MDQAFEPPKYISSLIAAANDGAKSGVVARNSDAPAADSAGIRVGTENASILATVRGSKPICRAASRRLRASICTA